MLAMSEVNCIKVYGIRNHYLSMQSIKYQELTGAQRKSMPMARIYRGEKAVKKEGMMYEEQWGEIVTDWLWEDEKLKKKQRRTNKKMFQDLKAMDFPGSYRTVCYFIKELELREEAKFMQEKTLTSFEWSEKIHFPHQLDSQELVQLHFIERKENLIFTGSTGLGKPTALGHEAYLKGFEVRFYRVSDLAEVLEKVWAEGKWGQFRNRFKKVDLVIFDEMGYVPFSKEGAELLFQLIRTSMNQRALSSHQTWNSANGIACSVIPG